MIKSNIYHLLIIFLILSFGYGCSSVRESAGVNRKSPDEFQVIENPPLVIPPDYSLVPPDQLQEKNIDNVEKELAEEILFGLEEKNIIEENQLSTMNLILSKTYAGSVSNTIRDEIDENFAKEMSTKDKLNLTWEDEIEVLNAVKESERLREQNFNNEVTTEEDVKVLITEEDVPIKKQEMKKKKKKRFFFF